VLVGQEQHLLTLLERPAQRALGVGRRAHRAAMRAGETLDRRRGVHVRDRDGDVGDAYIGQHVQASSSCCPVAMSAIEHPAARSGKITF